ncbi:MAG: arylesterase [Rhodobiaceae bacterium]|jgi:acyl-CoA thioesterase-1|nr:arylesterase [Rhodobiaceae bacterium]
MSPKAFAEEAAVEIVALGDSLTAGYQLAPGDGFVPQLQAYLRARGQNVRVRNGGVSGDTSAGGRARLDWVLSPSTKAVIVELGANDMLRGISPTLTRKNLEAILIELKKRNLPVLLAGMMAAPNLGPAYARAFNPIYRKLAEKYDAVYYPFFLEGIAADRSLNLADGIHPNREGIAVIVKNISPSVEKLLARIK